MSQALYTSKTGIVAGQTQIDVVAHNVANINTTAYKTANVTFSTLFSKTLSSGSAATATGGGTNPKQIGLGTQVASISRNFESGSFQSTGIQSDMMVSGNGYFVVQEGNEGPQYLTRDGHFTLDSDGNLVTATGLKVVGTISDYSTFSSNTTVKVPTMLNVAINGTAKAEIATRPLEELNATNISTGTFTLNVGGTTSSAEINKFTEVNANQYTYDPDGDPATANITYNRMDMANLSTEDRLNMTELYGDVEPSDIYWKGSDGTYIKGKFPVTGSITIKNVQQTISYRISDGDLRSSLEDFVTSVNNELGRQLDAHGYNQDPANPPVQDLKFEVIDGGLQLINNTGVDITVPDDKQSSTFLVQTGLADELKSATSNQTVFFSKDLNQSAVIGNSFNSVSAIKKQDWAVSESGVVSATYNDGSSLTVTLGAGGLAEWQYTTAEGVIISGNGMMGSDLDMSDTGLTPANMVLQMGVVINDAGLIAEVDNLWSIGPNAGEFAYGMSGANGFGSIKTGGLEGSNVDMATELSNMILAQRAIQMNSRVFGTASSVLEQLAYLGQ